MPPSLFAWRTVASSVGTLAWWTVASTVGIAVRRTVVMPPSLFAWWTVASSVGTLAWWTAASTLGHQFTRRDLAVVVSIEFFERVGSRVDLIARERTVGVRVQRDEQGRAGRPPLGTARTVSFGTTTLGSSAPRRTAFGTRSTALGIGLAFAISFVRTSPAALRAGAIAPRFAHHATELI